ENPHAGQEVGFTAEGSSDPDGSISSFEWDLGDGATLSGRTVSHVYGREGAFRVTLTVTDDDGATGSSARTLDVQPPNVPPTASFVVSPDPPEVGRLVTFNASGSTDSDGTITSFSWDLGDGRTGSATLVTHTYRTSGTFTVSLTVADDDGASAVETRTVEVTPPALLSFAPIAGEWEGTGVEPNTAQTFLIDAAIDSAAVRGEVVGTVAYNEGQCEGDWIALEADDPVFTVTEVITLGRDTCPDGTVVLELDPTSGELQYDYTPVAGSGPFEATGTLTRKE
ncbi:MAG: PKD domain-containing protein, partial [Halobacteriales archaeon]|nr:PKD domain-containing protein [Halobacteriales archaeon]